MTEVFVLAQRFHLTFDHGDGITTRGAVDESGKLVTMENVTNDRKTIGMNGSGFVEMLARQMTAELQAERDATPPGKSTQLLSKGISFGALTHNGDGTWSVSQVQGLAAPSLSTKGTSPPSLIIRPLHQVGNVMRRVEMRTSARVSGLPASSQVHAPAGTTTQAARAASSAPTSPITFGGTIRPSDFTRSSSPAPSR